MGDRDLPCQLYLVRAGQPDRRLSIEIRGQRLSRDRVLVAVETPGRYGPIELYRDYHEVVLTEDAWRTLTTGGFVLPAGIRTLAFTAEGEVVSEDQLQPLVHRGRCRVESRP